MRKHLLDIWEQEIKAQIREGDEGITLCGSNADLINEIHGAKRHSIPAVSVSICLPPACVLKSQTIASQ
jgi:hypothetical protein